MPLGSDTPFDPSIDSGVEPLRDLYAQQPPAQVPTPKSTSPLVTPGKSTTVDESSPLREFLAQALMGLGEGFGHKTPAFLTQELNQRAADRRQDKTIQAAQERQFANQQAIASRQQAASDQKAAKTNAVGAYIAKAQELEANGDIPGSMLHIREALKHADDPALLQKLISQNDGLVKSQRMARAVDNAIGMMVQQNPGKPVSNLEAMRFAFGVGTQLAMGGDPDALKIPFLNSIKEAYQGAVTQHLIGGPGGSNTLVEVNAGGPGPRVTKLAEQAGVLPENHGGQAPGLQIPGETPPVVAPPAAGTVVPAGSGVQSVVGATGSVIPPSTPRGPMPTAEQAPFLTDRGIPANLSWNEIGQKYPQAAGIFRRDVEQAEARRRAQDAVAQKNALAGLPLVLSGLAPGKVPFNKETRQRDDTMTGVDVANGKAVPLDATTARDVSQLSAIVAGIENIEKLLPKILATSPGANLGQAVTLAAQRGLASNADLAAFEALTGPLRLAVARTVNGGRPSDKDEVRTASGFASTMDTMVTAPPRLKATKQMLINSIDGYLGKPVGPPKEGPAGPPPREGSAKPGGGRYKLPPLPSGG